MSAAVSVMADRRLTWENETSPRDAVTSPRALTHPSDTSGRRAGVSLPSKARKRPDRRPLAECSVDGCGGIKRIQARGMCATHYSRWRVTGDPLVLKRKPRPEGCAVDGCDQPNYCREWCLAHYGHWRAYGDPLIQRQYRRTSVCSASDCDRPAAPGRHCRLHTERLAKFGNLDAPTFSYRRGHSNGYVLVKIDGHPLAQPSNGYVYEHRAVLFDKIGPGEHRCHWCPRMVSWDRSYPQHPDALTVDHLDGVHDNNAPKNLVPSCPSCNCAWNPPGWYEKMRAACVRR